MKIYSNKIIFQNTKPSIDLSKLPDDIFLIIASFLNKKDKRNYKNINKFISNYYHKYLDISDTIIIACQRNNIEIIKQYFTVKEIQKLIFSNVIKNNYINIFNNLPLNNLYHETYETIITKSCVHNCYKIIEIVFPCWEKTPTGRVFKRHPSALPNQCNSLRKATKLTPRPF